MKRGEFKQAVITEIFFFFSPFPPPPQSQPFRNILGLGFELEKLSSPSLKLLYVLRFDVTSGHGGEEVGGRDRNTGDVSYPPCA